MVAMNVLWNYVYFYHHTERMTVLHVGRRVIEILHN